ncbi:MAG: Methionine--tRNA ligase [Owenweeksia sp. TMED14]|nr:MAG: Methionine--tRNA ligase [Owenweeksia sp. TMED14]|tara:strand:+ start:1251 stop:2921 length:1671 start_codon:yes stop_codon:yes gene_type:complete
MKSFNRTTVTAALPYANGPIHIGHLAGCYLPADIYVRYLRMLGQDVAFVCGSDEHGMAITMKARSENISPSVIVNRYNDMMRNSLDAFGVSFDIYSRTSSPKHAEVAQSFFRKLNEKGTLQVRETEQYYDPEAEQFLADRYITGTCPNCKSKNAYGDQCEKCGTTLSPLDLIDPKSTLSKATPVMKKTKNWFLPLDKLSPQIRSYIEGHPEWKSNVLGQCKSWLDSGEGLQPRSMTRDLDWGVPVPVEGAEGKVLYVWFDAPLGYITATQELHGDDWEKWWKSDDTRLVHFIGKDNIVFHAIIFPALLMEHGDYILPEDIPANEFLNLEGDKLSTSKNWAVWLHEYLEDFPGNQDALRYALCATMPEAKDNDFTWSDFQIRNNSELVAILGNLVNRVMVLNNKYYQGIVQEPGTSPSDAHLMASIAVHSGKVSDSLKAYRFREALTEAMNLARLGNKYLADEEPWKKMKTDPKRTAEIMGTVTQFIAAISGIFDPFIPFSAEKIRSMLGIGALLWSDLDGRTLLSPGSKISEPRLLFEKIEDHQVETQKAKLKKTS